MTEPADEGYVKIRMSDDTGEHVETLWAITVGPGRFRIDNIPWFAYRVSLGDIVEGAEYAPGMYDLTRVIEPSGNRAIRLILGDGRGSDTDEGKRILDRLKALGCDYEGATHQFIGITIPPEVELQRVADYLVTTNLDWEYANPKYDDLFGSGASSGDIHRR